MWYHEYLLAAEAKAIKAEEPALPLSQLIDMERSNGPGDCQGRRLEECEG